MSEKRYAVAIDGPSGAGKSTLARAAARALGILYVDTGAIYRTVGLYVRQRGVEPADQPAVQALLREIHIEMRYGEDGLQRMLLCGADVTDEIRLPEISVLASQVSAIPAVRDFLLEMQRDMARRQSVIMDGRDIGTVVLPAAEVKIYLTASAQERARRRYLELQQRGTPQDFDQLLREIEERDMRDRNRSVAPLRPAEDAVVLDTTACTFEQSLEKLLGIVRARL